MREILITENEAGQRLDRFLRKLFKQYSLGEIYKLFRTKKVKVSGRREKENYMLQREDVVQLYLKEEVQFELPYVPTNRGVLEQEAILYEDSYLLAVHKPAGLLTQGDNSGDVSLVELAKNYLRDKEVPSPVTFSPAVCNRLDRNTGGIVLVAKNYPAAKCLNRYLRERRIQKFYHTVVAGQTEPSGEIRDCLRKDGDSNLVEISTAEDAKLCETRYRRLVAGKRASLLEVELITGRTHQIRVHLAGLGHPMIGDRKYGDAKVNDYYRSVYGLRHQLLYADRLEFGDCDGELSYLTGKVLSCPLPERYQKIIYELT